MNLRPMTMADADKMLGWKNYPETRQFAILTKEEIKKEDHYKWLEENIQFFQVIYSGSELVRYGAIRIRGMEISIWIDREFWHMGIASYILEQVSEVGMTAKVVEGNVGSMRAFINAGFKPVSYHNNYYIFQR